MGVMDMVERIGYKVLETCGDGNHYSPCPRTGVRTHYPVNEWFTDAGGHGIYVFVSHEEARAWIDRQTNPEPGHGAMIGKLWEIWECRCDGDIRPGDNPDNPEELRVTRLMLVMIVEQDPRITQLAKIR